MLMNRAHKLIATAALGILLGAAANVYTAGLSSASTAYAETGAAQHSSAIRENLTWLRWPAVHRTATMH
jgi:hypothetical protein